MKKLMFIVFILLCIGLLFSAPIIKFDSLKYNFGDIKEEGNYYDHEYKFTNEGSEPLKIEKVKAG